jgi:cytoskeletal protein RodZ
MQSDNFDKKIRDSLSQRPPGNDKPEWEKMEALLDKHLPEEKKDRRRIFFILFSFLLLGGGAFLVWQNNSGNKNEITSIDSQKQNSGSAVNNNQTNTDKGTSSPIVPETNQTKTGGFVEIPDPNISGVLPGKEIEIDASRKIIRPNKKAANDNARKANISKQTIDELVKSTEPERSLIEKLTKDENQPTITQKNELVKAPEVEKTITENKVEKQKEETKEIKPEAVEKTDKAKQKDKNSFANNFFVTVSAGPDISGVGGNAGELRLAYGAGIGYQISKKFSVRAGFYAARKVYTAEPEDYHPPYNFWTYYPNLKNIEANCKVYEIPVTVDYKISSNKKESWFVSAGVSSLLMKEETYDYYYKPNSSPTYLTYSRTIYDQNKHYFSVLNLSGGYTRVLNKTISLQAEPYVKLSMTGVGYGKVDLNSGGILFSAIIKPFAKK